MHKPILAVFVLISMIVPSRADDTSPKPIPDPAPEIANAEQQVWRWTNQADTTQPDDFLLALYQPSATTKQIAANMDSVQSPNMAVAENVPDDTRGIITGSFTVPLPIGIPSRRPKIAPLSAVTVPVEALGFVGDDGVFHAK